MSNRLTKGKARFGSVDIDTDGGLSFAGTDLTATVAELNRQDVSVNGAADYVKVISIVGAGSTAEQDSTYDLPARAYVRNCDVYISAAATAGAVLDIGLLASSSGGDVDGFLDGIGSSGTGLAQGSVTYASSSGVSSSTFGTFLIDLLAASGADAAGHANRRSFRSDSVTAKSVSWTLNSTGTAFAAKIILQLTEVA